MDRSEVMVHGKYSKHVISYLALYIGDREIESLKPIV